MSYMLAPGESISFSAFSSAEGAGCNGFDRFDQWNDGWVFVRAGHISESEASDVEATILSLHAQSSGELREGDVEKLGQYSIVVRDADMLHRPNWDANFDGTLREWFALADEIRESNNQRRQLVKDAFQDARLAAFTSLGFRLVADYDADRRLIVRDYGCSCGCKNESHGNAHQLLRSDSAGRVYITSVELGAIDAIIQTASHAREAAIQERASANINAAARHLSRPLAPPRDFYDSSDEVLGFHYLQWAEHRRRQAARLMSAANDAAATGNWDEFVLLAEQEDVLGCSSPTRAGERAWRQHLQRNGIYPLSSSGATTLMKVLAETGAS